MNWLVIAGTLVCCYLVGSIPFGYLVARGRGIDIRQQGSRNIGATNVSRVLGRKFGAAVLVLDVLKGLLPTLAAGRLLGSTVPPHGAMHYGLWLAAAAACILGHICPLYLRFKGGKGVATGLGATLGVYPALTIPGLIAIVIWLAVTFGSRYVSLGSVLAAASCPVSVALTLRPFDWQRHWPILLYAVLIPALVVYRHRGNIARLVRGTETRIDGGPTDRAP